VSDGLERVLRLAIVLTVATVATVAGWVLFVNVPGSLAQLLGIVLVVLTLGAGLRTGGGLAGSLFPEYDVAEVHVSGPISRSGSSFPPGPVGARADEIVEQIERADADDAAEALLVRLNTPGGAVVPSDDVRRAVADFDGPTLAYAEDTCASGGYWIATGCDEIWSHESSLVGSIGVIASRVNAAELADRLGLSYERIAAGQYKDAGLPLKDFTDDDREYLQGIADRYYDQFVDKVTERETLDAESVRDTEARVYLGADAHEEGLVDRVGTRADVEEALADRLSVDDVSVREFEPERSLKERLSTGVQGVARAFGAGLASPLVEDDAPRFRL
jgi:protease-4